MPQGTRQQSETERDEAIAKALGITGGASGFAALLGLPVAEFVRKQIMGKEVLKGIEDARVGKKLLSTGAGKLADVKKPREGWNENSRSEGRSVGTEQDLTRTPDGKVPKSYPRSPGVKLGPGGTTTLYNTNPIPATAPDLPAAVDKGPKLQRVTTRAQIRKSATDSAMQKMIEEEIKKQIERLTDVAGNITRPIQTAIDPKSVDKSVRRQQIKTEKTTGTQAAGQARAEAVKAKETAARATGAATRDATRARSSAAQAFEDLTTAKLGVGAPSVLPRDVASALEMRLPDVKRERSRLVTQRNQLQSSLGVRPKSGRTKQSRELLAEWDAKNAQIEALNKQVASLDTVVTPSGSPRPATSQILNDPNFLAREGATQLGGGLSPQPIPGSDAVAQARENYNDQLFGYNRANQRLNATQRPEDISIPPPYRQPMGDGGRDTFTSVPDPANPGSFTTRVDPLQVQMPSQEFDPGRDPYSALSFGGGIGPTAGGRPLSGSPLPNAGPSRVRIEDVIDPGGIQKTLDQFSQTASSIKPDYGTAQTGENLVRLLSTSAIQRGKKGNAESERSLISRVLDMLQGGSLSPTAVQSMENRVGSAVGNNKALRDFSKANMRGPDLSNAEDLAMLTEAGYVNPKVGSQGSLISNASTPDSNITIPRTRIGMNSAAATAAESLGLGSRRTFNPDLFPGKPNVGKLAKVGMGTSALATGGVMGYNYLAGLTAEKEAKAEAAKLATAKKESTEGKVNIAALARGSWNAQLMEGENRRVSGDKLFDKIVERAINEGKTKNLTEEQWKEMKTIWMSLSKARHSK